MKRIIICGAVIALCLACGSDEDGDGAVLIISGGFFPDCGPGNVLAFVRDGDLYRCDEQGRNVTRLTYTPYDWEENPVWSPDGEYIAYAAEYRESRKAGIFIIHKNGGEPVQLTTDRGKYPDWSPDGLTVAYNDPGNYDIWTVPASGGEPRRLTTRGYCSSPRWSRNGEKVFFSGPAPNNLSGFWFLWYVDREGGDAALLWLCHQHFYYLALSPGGEWVAAAVDPFSSPSDIWLFNVKSGDRFCLTREPRYESDECVYRIGARSPTWTEDGDRVIFGSDRYGAVGIYEISVKR